VGLAKPFVPQDDEQVLERLPYMPGDPAERALRAQRNALSVKPYDAALAIATAREYIRKGRAQGDPRYFGYAQAALASWWNTADAPAEILILRADIKQAAHDFAGALRDLNLVLEHDPGDVNAALTRAIILQVKGRYDQARPDCATLLDAARVAPHLQLTAVTCAASVASFSGNAAQSFDALRRTLQNSAGIGGADIPWALTTLADIAVRLGRPRAAEKYFRAALTLGEDTWLLGAYADFLLQQGRPQEVIELLKDDTEVDSLLLLLALAEQDLDLPQLGEHIGILRERFAASRLRDDQRHLREEARFALRLLDQPRQALKLARTNWKVQREPEDARILMEAALAALNPRAAQPVILFLDRTKLQDVRLERLREQLATGSDA
jgi:Tfp pilus assembly protein PilF